eukprot:7079118-Ditylum_brightwellii.AAC.1
MAMKTGVEEVSKPTCIFGDNRSVIINSTISSSLLKKKQVAISDHIAHEATAAKIINLFKTKGDWNFADVSTKLQTRKVFSSLVLGMIC